MIRKDKIINEKDKKKENLRMRKTPPPLREGNCDKTKKPTAHIHLHKFLFLREFFGKSN